MSEKNNLPKNYRLRAQFEGIDRMVTAPPKLVEAVKSGTPLAGTGNRYTAGFHVRKFAKAAVAYAACVVVLLGVVLLLPNWLDEITPAVTPSVSEQDDSKFKPHAVQPVGDVPKEFQTIVEDNLFYQAKAYENCLMKIESGADSASVIRYSIWGEQQIYYKKTLSKTSKIMGAIPTSDGGILAVYSDYNGYSDFIKIAADGKVEWEYHRNSYRWESIEQIHECENGYCFVGVVLEAQYDITLMKISKDGQTVADKIIGGGSGDFLSRSQKTASGLELYGGTWSADGDFANLSTGQSFPVNFRIVVDDEFSILSIEAIDSIYDYVLFRPVGTLNGVAIDQIDPRFADYDGGIIQLILDYGDQYMLVSENNAGEIKEPPSVSTNWYYTETVYSMYSEDGILLWRATQDSTPSWLYDIVS